jgi:hypothetical protein
MKEERGLQKEHFTLVKAGSMVLLERFTTALPRWCCNDD